MNKRTQNDIIGFMGMAAAFATYNERQVEASSVPEIDWALNSYNPSYKGSSRNNTKSSRKKVYNKNRERMVKASRKANRKHK
jgi:hypothetical protein